MPPRQIAEHPGRSHPPSLLRLVERLLRDERLIERGDTVLCACSGGPDSTAMLHVLGRLRRRFGFDVAACGVDHGLRPEAPEELAGAQRVAASLHVPFDVARVTVAPGGNLQARARAARREALRNTAIARGARLIATGHTADDRAETFLLRLLRGAGPAGLAVLPPSAPLVAEDAEAGSEASKKADAARKPRLIRPLLLARRSDVLAHLERHGIAFARDPSNDDTRFLRVRVRAELLPLMESMSPGIAAHLCALADMLATELGTGDPLTGLGRAQRLAIARAKKCERPVKLRLSGGRDVVVAFSEGEPVLMGESHERGPSRGP